MIHVDGPPGSGAVALARRLATDLHYRLEVEKPLGHQLPTLVSRELTASPWAVVTYGYHTLHACARAVSSSRYRAPLERWELRLLDRAALSQGALLIYCSARAEEVAALADPKEQRDNFTQLLCKHHDRLLAGYQEALSWTNLPRVTVDGPRLTEDGYSNLLAWIRGELALQRPAVLHYDRYRSSGQYRTPTAALVGDRYPELGLDHRDQPGARALLRGTGSCWTLHRALSAAELEDAYLTNWLKTGDEVHDLFTLRQELEAVDPRHVVALGTAAGRALRRLRIPHTELTHPSHQRRFNAGAFGAYVKRLTRAASSAPDWPPVHLLADL